MHFTTQLYKPDFCLELSQSVFNIYQLLVVKQVGWFGPHKSTQTTLLVSTLSSNPVPDQSYIHFQRHIQYLSIVISNICPSHIQCLSKAVECFMICLFHVCLNFFYLLWHVIGCIGYCTCYSTTKFNFPLLVLSIFLYSLYSMLYTRKRIMYHHQ